MCFADTARFLRLFLYRKERRRQGWLWYAYRRVHPVLHKRYVGKSDGLTVVKLEETAVLLNEIW